MTSESLTALIIILITILSNILNFHFLLECYLMFYFTITEKLLAIDGYLEMFF